LDPIEAASTQMRTGRFDLLIGCRSLKIHRVELALSAESIFMCTVPPATNDCVTKVQLERD
jgi:hypothetical protein